MPNQLKPGDRCDGYELIRYLGSGRASEVWAARAPNDGFCALKIMSAPGADKARARFVQEGEAVARIVHPSVVRVFGAGTWDDRAWLALELIEGEALRNRIRPGGSPPPIDDLLDWIQQVCEGLAEAHACGVVHRGIDLDCILITEGGRARLVGFGIAKFRGWGIKTTEDQKIGSAMNMAPEWAQGAAPSPSYDIYALGHVLYEALSGCGHAMGDTPRAVIDVVRWHLWESARPLREVAPHVPPDLAALVHEMIDKDPGRRPPSARAVIERIQRLRGGLRAAVIRVVRSVPQPEVVPAMATTIPMPACDVAASAPAPSAAPMSSVAPASSLPTTSAIPTTCASGPVTSAPVTTAPVTPATTALMTTAHAAPALGTTAVDRVAMLPAAGPTLVSAAAPRTNGPVSHLPQPSVGPAAPAELRATDVPVEGAARRSSITPRRASAAAFMVLAGCAALAAGWMFVVRASGPAVETRAPRPAAPPPPTPPAPAITASASAPAALPSNAPGAKPPARRPPRTDNRAPAAKPAKNRLFDTEH